MSREWRNRHFFEALRDVKTWLWFVMVFCISVPSNGLSTFGPLIIQSFVSDPFRTMLFNVPVGISHVLAVSLSAYASMKWKVKGPVIVLLCIPPLIGLSLLLAYPHDASHRGILLTGYFFLSTFTGISTLPGLNLSLAMTPREAHRSQHPSSTRGHPRIQQATRSARPHRPLFLLAHLRETFSDLCYSDRTRGPTTREGSARTSLSSPWSCC